MNLRSLALLAALFLVALIVAAPVGPAEAQSSVRPPEGALANEAQGGAPPGNALGSQSDSDLWRAVRSGETMSTSLPDPNAGVLVQSEGEAWRHFRNGPLLHYGGRALLWAVFALLLFFIIRGRIRISTGWSGVVIPRFNWIERAAHWMLASSFIVLALTGLNLLYGRHFLPGLIGAENFGALTYWGKFAHNFVGFAFMVALVIVFVIWVFHNLPTWTDVKWFARGGGVVGSGHPDARKFNGGQKLIFWSVIVFGVSISATGLALMFPFELPLFAESFVIANKAAGLIGWDLGLPETLTPMQEQQLSQLWHSIVALGLVIVILAHIYIGSLGMEGAFAAMGSGEVDLNWARDHHSLWVQKLERQGKLGLKSEPRPGPGAPAE